MGSVAKNPTLWLFASALTAGTALAAANFDATLAGWSPLVSLWGGGDAKQAVRSLEQVTSAYDAVLHRSEIDEPTQKFIDGAFDQLEDFDLDGFHDLLPDERAGYRQLTVQGELAGKQYKVGRAAPGSKYEVGVKSPRKNLADMSILIRSKEHDRRGEHDSYLIGGRVGFGIGPLSYRALMDSWTEALRDEVIGKGVSVALVCPATTDTEFFMKAERGKQPAASRLILAVPPERVARAICASVADGRYRRILPLTATMFMRFKELSPGFAHAVFRGLTRLMERR